MFRRIVEYITNNKNKTVDTDEKIIKLKMRIKELEDTIKEKDKTIKEIQKTIDIKEIQDIKERKFIYVIKQEGERYYIGVTNNIKKRYNEHITGNGSIWTKTYKPVSLEKCEIKKYKYEEDLTTLEYMNKYGIEKVRGGSFCQLILPNVEKNVIEKILKHEENKCFKCNKTGHYVKECKEDVKQECKEDVKQECNKKRRKRCRKYKTI